MKPGTESARVRAKLFLCHNLQITGRSTGEEFHFRRKTYIFMGEIEVRITSF